MHLGSTGAGAHAFALVACCVVGGMACQTKPGADPSPPSGSELVAADHPNPAAARGPVPGDAPVVATEGMPALGNAPASRGTSPGADVLPIGRPCRVHLRRDALGLSAVAPLSIQHLSPAARATWLEGSIERVTDQWVVIHSAGRPYWVRADVILAVELLDEEE